MASTKASKFSWRNIVMRPGDMADIDWIDIHTTWKNRVYHCQLCPLLLTWFNFNPSMDK